VDSVENIIRKLKEAAEEENNQDVLTVDRVESLIKQLKETDGYERIGIVEQLGRTKDPRAVHTLIDMLEDPDWDTKFEAAMGLGRTGVNNEQFEQIVELLKKGDEVTMAALNALGYIGDPKAIPILIRYLTDDNETNRLCASNAFADLAEQNDQDKSQMLAAVPHLKRLIHDESPDVADAAIDALGKIKSSQAAPELILSLRAEDDNIRNSSASSLAEIGVNDEQYQVLVNMLDDGSWGARAGAAMALGGLKKKDAVPLIKERLKDENPDVRKAGVISLGQFDDPSLVPSISGHLSDEDSDVRQQVTYVLWGLGERIGYENLIGALPDLIEALGDDNVLIKSKVVEMLESIGVKEENIERLKEKLENGKSLEERCGAAMALGKLGDCDAIPFLINAHIYDDKFELQQRVVEAMGDIAQRHPGAPEIEMMIPFLFIAVMTEEDGKSRKERIVPIAITALGKCGEYGLGPLLEKFFNSLHDKYLLDAVARGLAEIGEPALEEFNKIYLESEIPYEIVNVFYKELERKLDENHFDDGTVAPPKKAPGNPDEMKKMLLKRLQRKQRRGKSNERRITRGNR
jgi:HEAT repeat protein